LISPKPGKDKVTLGESFSQLSDIISVASDSTLSLQDARKNLQNFQDRNLRYVNAKACQEIDCLQAVESWIERLNSIVPQVDFTITFNKTDVESIQDRQASLRLINLAEDFMLITKFCRDIESAQISVNHSDFGIEFEFNYSGSINTADSRKLEDRSLNILLAKSLRESSLRPWINCTATSSELRVIVLKPNARLGFSPAY
tara:strand:- start:39 stop:641 length:603 start_codon:yes stop_codon:yes gene_type:complete